MLHFHHLHEPDTVSILTDSGKVTDAQVRFARVDGNLQVFLQAEADAVCEVRLRWHGAVETPIKIMGDAWERGYGELEWRGIVADRLMPWYCFLHQGDETFCMGVKVRPNAFCGWLVDTAGITLVLNVRSGGVGVHLNGRELAVCTVVTAHDQGISAFEAADRFCGLMCTDPLPVDEPIYGGNDWYYAYGNISTDNVLEDAAFIAEMTKGLKNRPYMVIDDGWEVNPVAGPWQGDAVKFPDMAKLARDIKQMDVRPGIWVRYLHDLGRLPDEWRRKDGSEAVMHLDPSHPAVLARVGEITRQLVGWGYELIKHDYTTYDIFDYWGIHMPSTLCNGGREMYDNTKTTAEIILNLYRVILENAENAKILGCNCVSHLCAGLVHANRIGDDTSDSKWDRVLRYGVNSLAFRMGQQKHFYQADADCIGISNQIDWSLNRQWLKLLAESGTPMFVSYKKGSLQGAELEELRQAFAAASVWHEKGEPLDWLDNNYPAKWKLDGKTVTFEWYK